MLFLFVSVMAFMLVVCLWLMGDVGVRAKAILTLIYLGSFALLFWNEYATTAVQALLSIIMGLTTFGADWGRR